jgi:allantoin racemase
VRITVVVPRELDPDELSARAGQVAAGTVGDDVSLDWVAVRTARGPGTDLDETYLAVAVVEAGIAAAKDGADSLVVDSFLDPGLYALRSRLSLPVVGAGLAAFCLSVDLGLRFAVLDPGPGQRHAIEKSLRLYGLDARCAGIRRAPADHDELLAEATRAVEEDGCDTIVLGSTTMTEAAGFLAGKLPVPVIDPGPVALKTAERLVRLGLTHSAVAFPAPNVLQDEKLAPLLD